MSSKCDVTKTINLLIDIDNLQYKMQESTIFFPNIHNSKLSYTNKDRM